MPPAGNRAGPAVSLSVALQLVRELRLDVARLRLKLLADVPRD